MATALVVVPLVILAITGGSDASWCVCKSDVSDTALQKTLDYACGAGADCSSIHEKGGCYEPDTVRSHCSYAANSYYQRKVQSGATCDFSGTATLTDTDPSYSSCSYPSTASAAGSATSTSILTPNGLVALGPSGSLTTDASDGGLSSLLRAGKGKGKTFVFLTAIIIIPAIVLLDRVM